MLLGVALLVLNAYALPMKELVEDKSIESTTAVMNSLLEKMKASLLEIVQITDELQEFNTAYSAKISASTKNDLEALINQPIKAEKTTTDGAGQGLASLANVRALGETLGPAFDLAQTLSETSKASNLKDIAHAGNWKAVAIATAATAVATSGIAAAVALTLNRTHSEHDNAATNSIIRELIAAKK